MNPWKTWQDAADRHQAVVEVTLVFRPDETAAGEYTRIYDPAFFFTEVLSNRDIQEFYNHDKWAAFVRIFDEDIRRHTKEQERARLERDDALQLPT